MGLRDTLRFILQHPLNAGRPAQALLRYARWQVGSRLAPGPVVVPWVEGTRLLVSPGMTGATGNVYVGLHEFAEMGFLLHALRPGDLFLDVGANVGSYTVLASGVVGARSVAFEPVPATYARLLDNLALNDLLERVDARNAGVGAAPGRLRFTTNQDTTNHVLRPGEDPSHAIDRPIERLDDLPHMAEPLLVKIDVEGHELAVIQGARDLLSSERVLAVIMETLGSESAPAQRALSELGLRPCAYDPLLRTLEELSPGVAAGQNTTYVRDPSQVRVRLETAPTRHILGRAV